MKNATVILTFPMRWQPEQEKLSKMECIQCFGEFTLFKSVLFTYIPTNV